MVLRHPGRRLRRVRVAEDGHEEAYLIREFDSLAAREELEARFYGSDAWRNGPREAILSAIESFHTIVIEGARFVTEVVPERQ